MQNSMKSLRWRGLPRGRFIIFTRLERFMEKVEKIREEMEKKLIEVNRRLQ
jgi:hypothetical protein